MLRITLESKLHFWKNIVDDIHANLLTHSIYGTLGGKPDFGPYSNGGGPQESADIYARR